MKIVFYFYSSFGGAMYGLLLDEAKKMAAVPKNEVYFAFCEGLYSLCLDNPTGNKGICEVCTAHAKQIAKEHFKGNLKRLNLKDFYKESHGAYPDSYNDALEFRNIRYREVSVGYSALSSYVQMTRNHDPAIDVNSKKYFDTQIKQACKLTDAFYEVVNTIKPDLVCTYNGRFNEVRPVFEVAKLSGIDFRLYEFVPEGNGTYNKVVFENAMPHDVQKNLWKIEACWNDPNLTIGENKALGHAFFTKRRNGIAAGDKVYIGNQKRGELPAGWDSDKINVAIFNSSEDEFVAIGGEYVDLSLYPSQIAGLKDIFERFKDSKTIHFYLRIHPNLGKVNYAYHKDLYAFGEKYSNLTLISPDSSISTYDLMEASNKIIVFGSTMGLESAYWGKPVILLCCGIYYYSNITYNPKKREDLFTLIEQSNLKPKSSLDILKIGLYLYRKNPLFLTEEDNLQYKYINYNPKSFTLFGRKLFAFQYQKFWGSAKAAAIWLYTKRFLAQKLYKSQYNLPTKDASGKS